MRSLRKKGWTSNVELLERHGIFGGITTTAAKGKSYIILVVERRLPRRYTQPLRVSLAFNPARRKQELVFRWELWAAPRWILGVRDKHRFRLNVIPDRMQTAEQRN